MVLYPTLINTGCLVRNLTLSLLRYYLTIYIDNYFTSIPLFLELRACKFGVVGTTRPYKEFPKDLIEVKNQFFIKLIWNTLLAAVVQDMLCLVYQDNNIILALSNIHTIDKAEDFQVKERRRPIKTLINSQITWYIFGDSPIKESQSPCFINNYN